MTASIRKAELYASLSPALGWAVLMSGPMAEAIAERSIVELGYRSYLPMSTKAIRATQYDDDGKRSRPRGEVVQRPAFRGYLFVELWPEQPWRQLLDSRVTRGVDSMILRGERPALLTAELIDALRKAEADGDFDEPRGFRVRGQSKRRTDINDGDIVRIGNGPFRSFLGMMEGQDDAGRAKVLLSLLGRDTPISIEATDLELVDD